jgi:hypothetical protein
LSKSKSDIWKYFTKEKGQNNKTIAKCNNCSVKYALVKGATTNLWTHVKKTHASFLGLSTTQQTLEQCISLTNNINNEILNNVINLNIKFFLMFKYIFIIFFNIGYYGRKSTKMVS